jgi:formyl-CoA transferase
MIATVQGAMHNVSYEPVNDMPVGPLSGVRVVELGNYIAAPTAGRLLADFGAEVTKVEPPGTGDELRNWRRYAGDTSMLFRAINRNKKSIVVDLKSSEGRDVVLDVAPIAHRGWPHGVRRTVRPD